MSIGPGPLCGNGRRFVPGLEVDGHRAAQTGHVVVAAAGVAIVDAVAVFATHDVAEESSGIAARFVGIESFVGCGQTERLDAGPLRRAGAGSADHVPAAGFGAAASINRKARSRIGGVGDVGDGPVAARSGYAKGGLKLRNGFVSAYAAPAAAPGSSRHPF